MPKKPVTLEDIAASIAVLQAEVRQNSASVQRVDSTVSGLQTRLKKLGKGIHDTEIAIADNNLALRDMRDTLREVEESIDDLGGSIVETGNMVSEQIQLSEYRIRADVRLDIDSKFDRFSEEFYKFRKDIGLFNDDQAKQTLKLVGFARKVSRETNVPFNS